VPYILVASFLKRATSYRLHVKASLFLDKPNKSIDRSIDWLIETRRDWITDRDGCEETLWNVGDDDSDEKDDGVEPVVAENEGDDEEGNAEEDSNAGDEVDEVCDLTCNGRLDRLQPAR